MQTLAFWNNYSRPPILDFRHGDRFVMYVRRPPMGQDSKVTNRRNVTDWGDEVYFFQLIAPHSKRA